MSKKKRISKDEKKLLEFMKAYQEKLEKEDDFIKFTHRPSHTEIKPEL